MNFIIILIESVIEWKALKLNKILKKLLHFESCWLLMENAPDISFFTLISEYIIKIALMPQEQHEVIIVPILTSYLSF
jgi:hypothetical protein